MSSPMLRLYDLFLRYLLRNEQEEECLTPSFICTRVRVLVLRFNI